MTWARIDDNFHDHPKILRAGLEATGLYVLALSHCSRYLTDGHVSRGFVEQKAGRRSDQLAARLVDAELWVANGDGWDVHDFLDYNPSRAQVKIESKKRSDAARHAARMRWRMRE